MIEADSPILNISYTYYHFSLITSIICAPRCLFSDNDTAESIDQIDERNRTNLRMKLKRNAVDKEEEDEEEKHKIEVIHPISDKRARTLMLILRKITALQSRW